MPNVDPAIVQEWYKSHPETTGLDIYIWNKFADRTDYGFWIEFDYEDWLASGRTTPPPDLIEWVSWYGYIRIRLPIWKLPIKLTPAEVAQWQKAGYYVTVEDFQHAIGSMAGGFLAVSGKEPQLTVRIMQQQLRDKLDELDRLASLPLDGTYTPTSMKSQIRQEFATNHGLRGAELDDAVHEAALEDDYDRELDVFDKPFVLRQQLESFVCGLEKFRLFAVSEHEPELNLPNQALHDALMQIDLNDLISRLAKTDPKLRRILKHLASYDCYDLNADYEPEEFWWRHWKGVLGRNRL
jgi:hypothetical protein